MGPVVGILGGGQLARMLALAGAPLGLRFRIVDTAEAACAGQVAPLTRADWNDRAALEGFAREVDVVTFDFENVPAETAQWLAERVPVFPNPGALAVAQDRLAEKQLFGTLGLATPPFRAVDTRESLAQACESIGYPCVLKTRRLGYDGKGQCRIRDASDQDAAWRALGGVPLILESWVAFEREVSVVAVRGRDGSFAAYPLTQNWHADGILSASLAPAPAAGPLEDEAVRHAQALADRLDYVGVLALELFVRDGALLANEIAPRVHNSGHWTIEGAWVSQFENHLRAVLGLPLGATRARGHAAMLNFVGALPLRDPVLREQHAYWHDYGKTPREGRKVGHATVTADDAPGLARVLRGLGESLGRDEQVAPVIAALERRT
jgi:5-(carboxyamino)imidazole ribonucleotide synthase